VRVVPISGNNRWKTCRLRGMIVFSMVHMGRSF
jgi:hypothetical protein